MIADAPLNEKYTAILDLHRMLEQRSIPHQLRRLGSGWQICAPDVETFNKKGGMDAIEHDFSYGARLNFIEVYGYDYERPVGFLAPKEALELFIKWNDRRNKK